jgi:hypothetical protein
MPGNNRSGTDRLAGRNGEMWTRLLPSAEPVHADMDQGRESRRGERGGPRPRLLVCLVALRPLSGFAVGGLATTAPRNRRDARAAKVSRSSVPPTSAAKAEGVWHLVARYPDIHTGVGKNPSPSKTDYKIRYGRWEAFWPCFGEQTATASASSAYTSRTALLTKRSAVRSTDHLVTKRA